MNSNFETAFFFDSDVWFCDGWEKAIDMSLDEHPHADVLWTNEGNFADFRGNKRDVYTSQELKPELNLYIHFFERNTGTIFGIRKNPHTRNFLKRAIAVWTDHRDVDHPANRGNEDVISNTDQGPFREAAFLSRKSIREVLLPPSLFCRSLWVYEYYHYNSEDDVVIDNNCQCNLCAIVHYGDFFDRCSANMTVLAD